MPVSRASRQLLTGWVAHPRTILLPEINFGRTLKKALKSNDLHTDFLTWSAISRARKATVAAVSKLYAHAQPSGA
jgi:hypothetical protein